MKLVFFTHPDFIGSESMSRYTRMLADGMKERGHEVKVWQPAPLFFKFGAPKTIKKWLGYIDQYVIFPMQIRKRLRLLLPRTIFVFADHALGPWVPLIKNRPHIIHCHDFLAQRSAKGEIPENPTGLSGRLYQAYIRHGYRKGKNFISVSYKTKEDLHKFLTTKPSISEVVYNGLNQHFSKAEPAYARKLFGEKTGIDLSGGYFLHVGGNQWYKNRLGVIEIYNDFCKENTSTLPLLLIGSQPSVELKKEQVCSLFRNQIHFLENIEDKLVQLAYSGASVVLFPSLAEGFGWPIAEAMACGCPVITTNEPPMTEVAGSCAFFIKRKPLDKNVVEEWARESSKVVKAVLELTPNEREEIIQKGLVNVKRFFCDEALNRIEKIYQSIYSIKEH